MISFNMLSSEEISGELANRLKRRRLVRNLTLEGLAARSGVAFGTLKKFEATGRIALPSFIRLVVALDAAPALEGLLKDAGYRSLDDVLKSEKLPKRGRIK